MLAVPGDPRRTRPPALGVAAGVDGGGVPSAAALEAGARRMERSRPRAQPPSTLTRPRYGP
ncbi:hypothetical protein ACFV08_25625 [Streptomyces fradiae]|uniref:hypothetical protein n=1 Tax=Streptomyces fradiae TaxID=1906 RepID=UPI0036986C1C